MSEQPKPGAKPESAQPEPARPRVGAGAMVASIVAAAFGVQSSRARERDFAHGNYRHFIVGGIVFTVLFVLTLVLVVRMVLAEP